MNRRPRDDAFFREAFRFLLPFVVANLLLLGAAVWVACAVLRWLGLV